MATGRAVPHLERDPDPDAIARGYEAIIKQFVSWATTQDEIRAAIVVGSRARDDHPADAWADLDIIVVAHEPGRYVRDPAWAERIGTPWIAFIEETPDGTALERRVLFAGGLDVDFAFIDATRVLDGGAVAMARAVFSRGMRVLLDRDGLIDRIGVPSAPAAPEPPDAETVRQVVSDFWYHAVWTAKHLRRGELWWAKSGCDGRLKELLRIALEWSAAVRGRDHWFRGRFFEEWVDPAIRSRLESAFARYDEADIWRALLVTMDLFTEVAPAAAQALGLPYPAEAELRARQVVESLTPSPGTRRGEPTRD